MTLDSHADLGRYNYALGVRDQNTQTQMWAYL